MKSRRNGPSHLMTECAGSSSCGPDPEQWVPAALHEPGLGRAFVHLGLSASGELLGLVLEDEAIEDGLGDLAGFGVELRDGLELKP